MKPSDVNGRFERLAGPRPCCLALPATFSVCGRRAFRGSASRAACGPYAGLTGWCGAALLCRSEAMPMSEPRNGYADVWQTVNVC